jgi:hypothetical protein
MRVGSSDSNIPDIFAGAGGVNLQGLRPVIVSNERFHVPRPPLDNRLQSLAKV